MYVRLRNGRRRTSRSTYDSVIHVLAISLRSAREQENDSHERHPRYRNERHWSTSPSEGERARRKVVTSKEPRGDRNGVSFAYFGKVRKAYLSLDLHM